MLQSGLDSDGAGLEFVAYETDDVRVFRDNPFLSRAEMRRVMARSLALYQRRHGGEVRSELLFTRRRNSRPKKRKVALTRGLRRTVLSCTRFSRTPYGEEC